MKKILLLLTTTAITLLVIAPAVQAQVWPSVAPPQAPPPKAPPQPAPEQPPAPTPPPAAPKAKQDDQQRVEIQDFEFSPAQLTVDAGTTVTWTNRGNAPHTVTADDGSFDSGRLEPGRSFSHTFQSSGTIPYHCEIHREMTASVTVTGGDTTGPANKATTQPTTAEASAKQTSSGGSWLTPALIVAVVVLAGALAFVILRGRAS